MSAQRLSMRLTGFLKLNKLQKARNAPLSLILSGSELGYKIGANNLSGSRMTRRLNKLEKRVYGSTLGQQRLNQNYIR